MYVFDEVDKLFLGLLWCVLLILISLGFCMCGAGFLVFMVSVLKFIAIAN